MLEPDNAAASDATRGGAASKPRAFFGRYLEVTLPSRLVWTNDESDDGSAGMESGMPETFAQLDELLVTLGASVGRS
jgi:hypothetical protein